MNFSRLKLELFYLIKAFRYKIGWTYFNYKFLLAPKILKSKQVFEKPITDKNLSMHLLTCHRDLIMLIWSLASFYHSSRVVGELFIHNDGSLTNKNKNRIKKFFPNCRIVGAEELLEDTTNRINNYPMIKKFRTEYKKFILLKKLIDPYFISDKQYRLIIDSDLLWFNHPVEFQDQLNSGCQQSLMMTAESNCPVYFKDGQRLPDSLAKLNSGVILYRQDNFDLVKLESYFNSLDLNNNDNRHFIEQAGYGYCLKNVSALPMTRYIVKGQVQDQTVMRHYTSPRRVWLYVEGLKILKNKGYV